MNTATNSLSPRTRLHFSLQRLVRLAALGAMAAAWVAGAPRGIAAEESSFCLTANLGRIYERLPKADADAEVERLLAEIEYDARRDVLVDLGNFSAPSLTDLDGILKIPPPSFVESSYALGALPVLRRRGLDAAVLGPRELLLDRRRYDWRMPSLGFVASSGREAGPGGKELTQQPFIEIGEELKVGGLLDMAEIKALLDAGSDVAAEPIDAYLARAGANRTTIVAGPIGDHSSNRAVAWGDSPIVVVGANGAGWTLESAARLDTASVFRLHHEWNGNSGESMSRNSQYKMLSADPTETDTIVFSDDLTPGSIKDPKSKPSRFELHSISVDVRELHRKVVFASFDKRFAPDDGEQLLARVERRRAGGIAIDGYTPPLGGFLLLRDAQHRYTLTLEDKPYRIGGTTLQQADLERLFGIHFTPQQLDTALARLPATGDLFEEIRGAVAALEAADAALQAQRGEGSR